jgi:hypothetical protein
MAPITIALQAGCTAAAGICVDRDERSLANRSNRLLDALRCQLMELRLRDRLMVLLVLDIARPGPGLALPAFPARQRVSGRPGALC